MLQVIPQSDPTTTEDISSTFILHAELHKLSAISDQFTCFGAEIDSVVCMHVWRLGGLEELSRVVFMAPRRKPFARPKESALCAIGDQRTTQV